MSSLPVRKHDVLYSVLLAEIGDLAATLECLTHLLKSYPNLHAHRGTRTPTLFEASGFKPGSYTDLDRRAYMPSPGLEPGLRRTSS